jgi:hypothetical protein
MPGRKLNFQAAKQLQEVSAIDLLAQMSEPEPRGPKCLNEKVTQDHGDTSWGYWPNGFWMTEGKAEKETTTTLGTVACSQNWDRPAGYLKSRVRVMRWVSGAWKLCYDSGFIQSNVTTPQWNVEVGSSPVASNDPPCGDGYYSIIGNASIKENGVWVGGQLSMSESEYLD